MAQKDINEIVKNIPTLEYLAGRFLFIKDNALRENITIAFQYIIFLLSIQEEIKLQGPVVYSIFKDVMVYTGSVVESCLHYCIKEYFKCGKAVEKDIMIHEWKEEKHVRIYKIDDEKEVCAVIRHKKFGDFSEKTPFNEINRVALRIGILTKDLHDKSEKIRIDRNKVHLVALSEIPDYFTKDNVVETFKRAKEIIERIEEKLLELEND